MKRPQGGSDLDEVAARAEKGSRVGAVAQAISPAKSVGVAIGGVRERWELGQREGFSGIEKRFVVGML